MGYKLYIFWLFQVKLEGLKEFGQNILEFLKASIEKTYPQVDMADNTPQQIGMLTIQACQFVSTGCM